MVNNQRRAEEIEDSQRISGTCPRTYYNGFNIDSLTTRSLEIESSKIQRCKEDLERPPLVHQFILKLIGRCRCLLRYKTDNIEE